MVHNLLHFVEFPFNLVQGIEEDPGREEVYEPEPEARPIGMLEPHGAKIHILYENRQSPPSGPPCGWTSPPARLSIS